MLALLSNDHEVCEVPNESSQGGGLFIFGQPSQGTSPFAAGSFGAGLSQVIPPPAPPHPTGSDVASPTRLAEGAQLLDSWRSGFTAPVAPKAVTTVPAGCRHRKSSDSRCQGKFQS